MKIFNLIQHIGGQRMWSEKTFGPADQRGTDGVIDHLRKEIEEVAENPEDLEEWIDIVMLAIDGAWRSGHGTVEICDALSAKLEKNRNRDWPDCQSVAVSSQFQAGS